MKKIFAVILLLQLSGCSLINIFKMRAENDDIQPLWQGEQQQYVLDTKYIGVKPHVLISIDGETQFLMLIDTGLSFSMLFDTEKVRKKAFERDYELPVFGWGNDESSVGYKTEVAEVNIGPVSVQNFSFAVVPVSQSHYFISDQEMIFDGVIGNDFLKHFAWIFDYQAEQVTISNVSMVPSRESTVLLFETSSRKISIPVTLDFGNQQPDEIDVKVDTGSRHYLKINTAYVESREIQLPAPLVEAADFGLSGKAAHQRFRLPKLSIGDLELEGVKTNLIFAEDEDDLNVIGSALFAHYRVGIDYLNQTISFTPYSEQPFSSRFNLSGLELREQIDGSFIVRNVANGFPTEGSPIAVGDVIESMNDIPTSEISTSRWLDTANTPGELKLCIRDKQCHSVVLQPIPGFSTLLPTE
ncbi:aspartyl protease family protein [Pseudidiomarina salilacus]|uniref:aspartyl protease family protein n=1 Tax=Pseudidiomarina salilacus TaxID=3384452 RepID=UPI003984BE22